MASRAYDEWVAEVKADGGRVTVAPGGWPAIAFSGDELRRRVLQGKLPVVYSKNMKTGYYVAPEYITAEILTFSRATPAEIAAGVQDLEANNPLFQLLATVRAAGLVVVGLVVLVIVAVVVARRRA